ncbi:MAG: biopolymer transporter ExbD [Firmicutes bacterium]|jgi:biopolymer transport protein ExbD|nr:biopolymer transporter ExbD [Bacillota bacterium]
MNFERTKRKRSAPNLVPLIDVMFFCLVFFMVFFNISSTPLGMDVELPKAVTGRSQEDVQFEVSVRSDGAFYVNGRMVTGPELRAMVQQRLSTNPDLFVIVKADRRVRYEHVVSALDHIRAVGGHRLGLAVDQSS